MDAAGIDVQVLSLNSPGVEQLDPEEARKVAKETNDFLADAVKVISNVLPDLPHCRRGSKSRNPRAGTHGTGLSI